MQFNGKTANKVIYENCTSCEGNSKLDDLKKAKVKGLFKEIADTIEESISNKDGDTQKLLKNAQGFFTQDLRLQQTLVLKENKETHSPTIYKASSESKYRFGKKHTDYFFFPTKFNSTRKRTS